MDNSKIMLWAALLVTLVPGCLSLLVDLPCEASLPCTCTVVSRRQHINCPSAGITTVPQFHNTSSTLRDMVLDLSNNGLSTVKTYAFKNLNHSYLSSFILHLENNKISTIQPDAFMGVARPMRELYLANNKLTTLSTAFTNLTYLQTLDIRNNSIAKYDPHVMAALGHALHTLSLGDASMTSWPRELHYIRYLSTLNLYYTRLQTLPPDAFTGFEKTLHTLRIDGTTIGVINPAICYLPNLKEFFFDNNRYYHGSRSIFQRCLNPISTMQKLHINNDELLDFPPVFALFPGLTDLYITNNPGLDYVDDSLVPANTKLANLYLSDNGFTRVPEAVQKMPVLKTLDLHDNRIRLVEEHDITDMDNLNKVRMDGNPIEYISTMAFQNMPRLQYVYLNASSLTEFPSALTSLPDPRDVYLPSDQIPCNCDSLGHLKNWRLTHISMHGLCEASYDRINDYIRSSLRGCPTT